MTKLPVHKAAAAGIKPDTYYHRIFRGWSVKEAISVPPTIRKRMPGEKQRAPIPVRLTAELELEVMKAAQRDGTKKSSWIKTAVMEKLSRKPRVRKINERNDQEQVS